MGDAFEGLYCKHHKGDHSMAVIAGRARDHAFVQIITDDASHSVRYPLEAFARAADGRLRVDTCQFGLDGIGLTIKSPALCVEGALRYGGLTPLPSDIMGPFRFLPMQCRHTIVSLRHTVAGAVQINGRRMDFTGGIGYIEGDRGRSFPKGYTWVQCGDLPGKGSIVASVADIPFAGLSFRGCIAVIYLEGRQYRLATYNGAKIVQCDARTLCLRRKDMRLTIDMEEGQRGQTLLAPVRGHMTRSIAERIACRARFRFFQGERVLLDAVSDRASVEHVWD